MLVTYIVLVDSTLNPGEEVRYRSMEEDIAYTYAYKVIDRENEFTNGVRIVKVTQNIETHKSSQKEIFSRTINLLDK